MPPGASLAPRLAWHGVRSRRAEDGRPGVWKNPKPGLPVVKTVDRRAGSGPRRSQRPAEPARGPRGHPYGITRRSKTAARPRAIKAEPGERIPDDRARSFSFFPSRSACRRTKGEAVAARKMGKNSVIEPVGHRCLGCCSRTHAPAMVAKIRSILPVVKPFTAFFVSFFQETAGTATERERPSICYGVAGACPTTWLPGPVAANLPVAGRGMRGRINRSAGPRHRESLGVTSREPESPKAGSSRATAGARPWRPPQMLPLSLLAAPDRGGGCPINRS
jgi:hypothetical protein